MSPFYPSRLKEIHDLVKSMNYSIDNMLEIINLFKESLRIAKKVSPHIKKNHCLQSLSNTRYSEYIDLISKDNDNEIDRKIAFNEFKTAFRMDLEMNCFNNSTP